MCLNSIFTSMVFFQFCALTSKNNKSQKFVRLSVCLCFIEIVVLLWIAKIFAPVDRAHRVTCRNDLFQNFRTLFFLGGTATWPKKNQSFYFWYFEHTNRKLLTRRTIKLPIVKRQLDRFGRYSHMTQKNQTFYFFVLSATADKLEG